MAKIPQDIPNQNPQDFSNVSKPVDTPAVDQTLSTLFKNIGSSIENVAKAGDTLFKQNIQDNLYKEIDPVRQKWIDTMGQMKADTRASGQVSASADGMDAMAQASADDIPEDLSGVADQAAGLQSARMAGKISPTNYWMQLDNISKDYRSRYPGYRDYIDQQISSITGHTPANTVFQSIMGDLRSAMAGSKTEDPNVKQARTAFVGLMKDGNTVVTPEEQAKGWEALNRGDYATVMGFVAAKMAPKGKLAQLDIALKTDTGNDQDRARTASMGINEYLTSKAWGDFDGKLTISGMTMQDVQKQAAEFAAHPETADPKKVDQLYLVAKGIMQQSQLEATRELNTRKDARGMSPAQVAVGPTGDANKWINENLTQRYMHFQNVVNSLRDKDLPAAAMWMEQMKAEATQDQYSYFHDPDTQKFARASRLLKDDPEAIKNFMKDSLPKNYGAAGLNAWWKRFDTYAQTQPDINNGQVQTVDAAIKKAQAAGVESPQLYKDFAEFGKKMLAPGIKEQTAYNIAAAMFHPANQKFLSNFTEDQKFIDAQGNERVKPGKYAVWDMYTNPLMAAKVAELGEKHPEVKKWYKDWVESGFGNDVFGPQIRNLSTIAADSRVQIVYDNVDNQLHRLDFAAGWDSRYAQAQQRRAGVLGNIDDQVDKLNQGLAGYTNYLKSTGVTKPEDIQGKIIEQLKGLGAVTPTPTIRPDPKTVSEQALNAIVTAIKGFNPLAGKSQDRVPRK